MTRDEIIRAMRSVCDKDKVDAWRNDFWTITQDELERFVACVEERAAAAEREACAQIGDGYDYGDRNCGDEIRARGKK